MWVSTGESLRTQLGQGRIEVPAPLAFQTGLFSTSSVSTLHEIKKLGIRVIALLAYDGDVQDVASIAEKDGMLSSGWAFYLTLVLVMSSWQSLTSPFYYASWDGIEEQRSMRSN